ncbi:drug/metabolite transporter (DMT)-like permease [Lewinella marina]|uniref:EamA family transporter n=1 Tax=Neolewinella marina TaxID=438751 RepID=A0A2G0CH52_9BACT|nr:DMT family transporter [Neolewinella marina]NJB86238.1 drug/metabolite transporter (DMT)-like permease [Neolewinella marina]PHK99288.1 EamA family transporter [Neolewinella marina]
MLERRPTVVDFLTLLGLSLIWGTSYILIKYGLTVFSAQQIAVLRLGLSALALSPFALTHLRRIRLRQLPPLLLVGLTGTAIPSFLFPIAQTHLSSSLTGMLSSLTPLCTFLVAWLVFRNRPVKEQVIGLVVGLLGAVLLAYVTPGEGTQRSQLAYAGLVLGACFCYGTSANLVAHYFRQLPSLTITVTSFFLVGLPALIYAFTLGGVVPTLAAAGTEGWWALGYVTILAVGSTVLASFVFFRLVQRSGAVFASTVSYLIPVVALLWGLVDNERFALLQLPAIGLVLMGVFLSKRK